MADYVSLKKFYHKDKTNNRDIAVQLEAKKRLEAESTFRTGIKIEHGELFLAVPTQLFSLSEKLLRVERKVSQLWRELPGIARWAYLRGLIMNEVISTNAIEGIHSTRKQIQEALESVEAKQPNNDEKRFKEFANLYLELTNNSHVSTKTPNDIRVIYDAVVMGELKEEDGPDGEPFRKESVDVVSGQQQVMHKGVMPESKIIEMLEQMIQLVNSDTIPQTFSAIISHFLFEYIHPFYDGNGRTGRFLLALYLSEPLSLATTLSLSRVICENKNRYYKMFTDAEDPLNYGEMTFFVIQLLEFIREAQESVMENLERKAALLSKIEDLLEIFEEEPYCLSNKQVAVLYQAAQQYLLGDFPVISLENITMHTKVGAQTARKYAAALEERGLLEAVSLKPLRFVLTPLALKKLEIPELANYSV